MNFCDGFLRAALTGHSHPSPFWKIAKMQNAPLLMNHTVCLWFCPFHHIDSYVKCKDGEIPVFCPMSFETVPPGLQSQTRSLLDWGDCTQPNDVSALFLYPVMQRDLWLPCKGNSSREKFSNSTMDYWARFQIPRFKQRVCIFCQTLC